MRACRYPWGVYIQADEVLHEDGARALREAIERDDGDPRVEGLLVRYLHFFGGLDTIATNRRWYRCEVRAVRLDPALDVRPYQGAQGFRVGPDLRKIRARLTDAVMFHYGWARPCGRSAPSATSPAASFPTSEPDRVRCSPGCRGSGRFDGQHPAVARRMGPGPAARPRAADRAPLLPLEAPAALRLERRRAPDRPRVFEFRNYKRV